MDGGKAREVEIDTSPTKEVLAQSLTRDVPVEACIYDLIDNSIDAARSMILSERPEELDENELPASYEGYKVEVFVSEKGVIVKDNCGGMSEEQARNSILRFGQPSEKKYGIGLYGIGLNRAIFKLGDDIHISSTTKNEHVSIDFWVSDYLTKEGWSLPANVSSPVDLPGTIIRIEDPTVEAFPIVGNTDAVERMKVEVAEIYYRFLQKGLSIQLNEDDIEPRFVEIRKDGPFPIMTKSIVLEDKIKIDVVAGQHIEHRFSAEPGHNNRLNSRLTSDYGWTVICNDRPVVLRNREEKTGWTTQFHTEFYGFVGYVRFYSEDGRSLPWNTSKTGVDEPNMLYRRALKEMEEFAKGWRKYARIAKEYKKKKKPLLPFDQQESPLGPPKPMGGTKPPEPPQPTKPKKLWAILPDDIDESRCKDKLRTVVYEAKNINIKTRRYTSLALMRMLFEIASLNYLISIGKLKELQKIIVADKNAQRAAFGKSPLKKPETRKLKPSLEDICAFLKANPEIWGENLQNHMEASLNSFIHRKPTLNSGLHHPIHKVGVDTVVGIRDEILPILRHFIEHNEEEDSNEA